MASIEKTAEVGKVVLRDPVGVLSDKSGILESRMGRSFQSRETFPHRIFAPVHYERGYAYPLIVWLHGSGADENQLFRIMPKLSLRNYVAVSPRGLTCDESGLLRPLKKRSDKEEVKVLSSTYDWPETEVGLSRTEDRVFESIDAVEKKYNIATTRIFLAGFDIGGTMALRLAAAWPERFAGAISLCGAFPEQGGTLRHWQKLREFPFFVACGAKSKAFPVELQCRQLEFFHNAGLPVTFKRYQVGQKLTSRMLQDVNKWIMEQILKQCDMIIL